MTYKRLDSLGILIGKKLLAIFLSFLFMVTPFTNVFAEDLQNSSSSASGFTQDYNLLIRPDAIDVVEGRASYRTNQISSTDSLPEIGASLSSDTGVLIHTPDSGEVNKLISQKPESDLSSGALVYTTDFDIPLGRNGLTPKISLSYNNQTDKRPNFLGDRWSLSIPYIQKLNKTGTEKLYNSNTFTSSKDGELVFVSGTTYAPKVENGSFLRYNYDGTKWTVKDKKGTVYTYGTTVSSRQDDPADSTKVYKWMLENVRDINNNSISYTYFKDQGEIYPDNINYGGNEVASGIFDITFGREAYFSPVYVPYTFYPNFKVKTAYRINAITAKINAQWVKKYDLTYTVADAGFRTLLASVATSGRDVDTNVVTTLPAETFSYKTHGDLGWDSSQTTSWQLPYQLHTSPLYGPEFLEMQDLNGDTYPDVTFKERHYQYGQTKFYISNTMNGWNPDTGQYSLLPLPFRDRLETYFLDWGTRVFDINGDMRNDMVRSFSSTTSTSGVQSEVYLSNQNGLGWNIDPNVTIPMGFVFGQGMNADNAVRIVDINGDGFSDILRGYLNATNTGTYTLNQKVYLGTGSGWIEAPAGTWQLPQAFVDQNPYGPEVYTHAQVLDLNGDNLPDITWSYNKEYPYYGPDGDVSQARVFINNGHGWDRVVDGSWELPNWLEIQFRGDSTSDGGVRENDTNGDGISDLLSYGGHNGNVSLINSGNPQSSYTVNSIPMPELFSSANGVTNPQLLFTDANADGASDFLIGSVSSGVPNFRTSLGKVNNFTDTLIKVTKPQGAIYEFSYKFSNKYRNTDNTLTNPNLPIIVETLNTVTETDPVGNVTGTTTYNYSGGLYYYSSPSDRKFAGFNKVSITDAVGNITTSYFHQGNTADTANGEYLDSAWKIGKPYRVEQYDNANNLYQSIVNKWDETDLGGASKFIKLARSTNMLYNGLSTHKDTSDEYSYDAYGNLIQKITWGEVTASNDGSFTDTGSDKATETISYVANTGNYVVGLPYDDVTLDQSGNKVNETRTYYDTLTLGSVGDGNPTKVEKWGNGSTYINTQKSYNTYGLALSSTDERGKVTNYAYDIYNLYPTLITNPLGQTTSYTYDYSSGKPLVITDPNNKVYAYTYDGLDRTLSETIPDPSTGANALKTSYIYTDTLLQNSIKKSDYLDASNIIDNYQYFDGFGKLIQERNEAETAGSFNVSDTLYNSLGLVQKQSLKYGGAGGAKTSSTTDTTLFTNYTYDPLGRVLTKVDALGTTSYAYNLWKTTVTDAGGKVKSYFKDPYGNLVKVEEVNTGSIYATNYAWNLNGNLINITDPLGNVRNFTYDGLGRRLTAEDLHAPSDNTFGIWSYTYDDAGNMIQSVNPLSQMVNYIYDNINRVTSENYTGNPGVETSYTYDSCTKGIGKLCSATVSGVGANMYTYDSLGNIATDQATISGNTYATSYTYDRQGNILSVAYPDNTKVNYNYNPRGYVSSIDRKLSNESTFSPLVSSITYNPQGQSLTTARANGVTSTYTYDQAKLYRLTNISSQKGTNPKIQDVSYTYDNVGNILTITDNTGTNTKKQAVYTYDDLYRLTSATITNVNTGLAPYTETYTYNSLGNILTKGGKAYTYTGEDYANPHAPTTIGIKAFTYDRNGNVISDGNQVYTWNYKNLISKIDTPESQEIYLYNHQNQRVKSTDSEGSTYTPNKYFTKNNTSLSQTKHIYLGSTLVGIIEDSTISFPFTDHLGSTDKVTDPTGNIIESTDYYPYGKERIHTGGNTKRRFIGQEYDTNTKLNYLNARYYDGDRGGFVSQDPMHLSIGDASKIKSISVLDINTYLLDPQQLNSYSYGRNNPINLSDPSGNVTTRALFNPLTYFMVGLGSILNSTYNTLTGGGNKATTQLFSRSLSLNPENLNINSNNEYSYVVDKIKSSSEYNSFISKAISTAEKNGSNKIDHIYQGGNSGNSINFTNGDLFTSIGGTLNISIKGEQMKNGSWNLNVGINDTYDFQRKNYSNPVVNTTNNTALIPQSMGVISKYNIKINFTDSKKK